MDSPSIASAILNFFKNGINQNGNTNNAEGNNGQSPEQTSINQIFYPPPQANPNDLADLPPISVQGNPNIFGKIGTDLVKLQDFPMTDYPTQQATNVEDKKDSGQLPTIVATKDINDDLAKKYTDYYNVSHTDVTKPILQGAAITGADPNIMFKIAKAESQFNPDAKSKTSSASGLFQYLNSTWNGVVPGLKKTYGTLFGGDRTDPTDQSIALGEDINNIKAQLAPIKKSGDITAQDVYLAHFSGLGGAKKVIGALEQGKGSKPASSVYSSDAINENKNIFYNNGKMRSIQEVYNIITNKVS